MENEIIATTDEFVEILDDNENIMFDYSLLIDDESDFSSDNYCKTHCEFYNQCFANHESCIKHSFKCFLQVLKPLQRKIIVDFYSDDSKYKKYDIAKKYNITCDRVLYIKNYAIRTLRENSEKAKLNEYFFAAFTVAKNNYKNNFYYNLLITLYDSPSTDDLSDYNLGIDSSIVIKDKIMHKSASLINRELDSDITSFKSLEPYIIYFKKCNISTLRQLLYTSVKNLLFVAFKKNDVAYYWMTKVLESMGYKIKDENNHTSRWLLIQLLKNSSIDSRTFDRTLNEISLNLVSKLNTQNIITVRDLLSQMRNIKDYDFIDEKELQELEEFLKFKGLVVNVGGRKYYITPSFCSVFFNSLIGWMLPNSHSIFDLEKLFIDGDSLKNNNFIHIIEKYYGGFEFGKQVITCIIPIEELDLSVRSYNCLKRAGINTLDDFIDKTEEDLMYIRNMGKKSLNEIKNVLASYGFFL